MKEETDPIRLLMIPSWYEHREDRGGGLFFHQMAKYLASTGMKVDLLHSHLKPLGPFIPSTGMIEIDGFRVWSRRSFAWPKRWTWSRRRWKKQFAGWMEHYRRKEGFPDILHAHGYEAASVAGEVGKEWNVPVIYSEHLSRILQKELKAHQRILYREATEHADLITAVSGGLAGQMHSDFGREVIRVPNMIDAEFFYTRREIPVRPVFLSIGDPWYVKGLDRLIEAAGEIKKQIPEIRLRLADRIPGRNKLRSVIARYGLEDRIDFLGYLSPEEVREELHRAAALVSASRFETFGMTMVEALSCGTPVLATPTAGAREIVHPHTGIILKDHALDSLRDGLEEILNFSYDPESLHDFARERFDRKKICARWRSIYRDLLKKRSEIS